MDIGFLSISAIKALKLAQQQGQKIYSINHFNKNNILPKLTAHSAKTLADVNNALNSGKEVTISEKPIKFYDWKGAGYIIIDTQTGAGAYMLEGNTNGNWTKNLKKKDQQFISSITYKKPRSRSIARFVVEQIVEEVVFSFIKHLIENSDELSECHKRVLLQFVALVEAALLISDVVGLLKASPARIMLSAVVPLLVIPVAYATTRALVACDKCDSDTSSRSNSVRSVGVRANDTSSQSNCLEVKDSDIDNIRNKYNLVGHTIGAAKTDIPGLDKTLEGLSPKLRQQAELPSLDEQFPNRNIKAPENLRDDAKNHAEEDILNQVDRFIISKGLTNSDLVGKQLNIHTSLKACNNCIQGINNPNARPGVVKQFSDRYPTITIKLTNSQNDSVKIYRNGKQVK